MNYLTGIALVFCTVFGLPGCSRMAESGLRDFLPQQIPITSVSAQSGEGSTILFRGQPTPLSGTPIAVGETLRSSPLTRADLSLTNLLATGGGVRIISIVPSVDTRVCEQQTHQLSEMHEELDARIQRITISIDTPFAQKRFAEDARIANVEFLSDYRDAKFGKAHGLFLDDPHLLSRAVMVIDEHQTIRHLQITPDLGQLPDLERAFAMAQSLLP